MIIIETGNPQIMLSMSWINTKYKQTNKQVSLLYSPVGSIFLVVSQVDFHHYFLPIGSKLCYIHRHILVPLKSIFVFSLPPWGSFERGWTSVIHHHQWMNHYFKFFLFSASASLSISSSSAFCLSAAPSGLTLQH